MQVRPIFLSLFLLVCFSVSAQVKISGIVLDQQGTATLSNVLVYLQNTEYSSITGPDGRFEMENVANGSYALVVETDLYDKYTRNLTVTGVDIQLDSIKLVIVEGTNIVNAEDIIPTVSLSENDLQSGGTQSISGLLTASRDVFINTAAFTFGQYRFNIRGYDGDNTDVMLNGVLMNDLETGDAYWSQWGGLNDVMRSRDYTIGLDPVDFTFGGVGGANNTDARASTQWDQLRVSYSGANRTYNHRLMVTYSTGVLKKGWAFSVSGSRRWAKEGYVPGTSYDAWSYFGAIEKLFGEKHKLGLTVMGAPNRRGKSSSSTQEAYDLAGTNYYNSNWGYQNGEKRNSRIAHSHLPTFILSHEWKISTKQRFYGAVSYQFGTNGATSLNWYNAPDPRPDYYRNLPSYIEDSSLREQAKQRYLNNPDLLQINWDNIYSINATSIETIENYNGSGRDTTINLARYIVEDRRYDKKRVGSNFVYENQFTDLFKLQAGVNYYWQRTYNYKVVDDLLGADLFVDINQFAERDYAGNDTAVQNNLETPNKLLKEGDRYGYDYNITVCRKGAFVNTLFTLSHFEFFLSGELSHTRFFRTGNFRNGLYPNDSYGDSEKESFINYGVKGGVTYKINGRNYLFANGGYLTRAPFAGEAYISPQTRNQTLDNLTSQKVASFEGGYLLKSPKLKARAVFYFTQFRDGIKTFNFYYDLERNFVNIALSGIGQRHLGGEFAIEGKIHPTFSITAVAGLGQHIYDTRQNATITIDNSSEVVAENLTIYSKNFFVSNGPQMAANIGLNYRSPKFWFASLYFNYFDRIWIDFNPVRRTDAAVDLVEPDSELWKQVINQQKADGQFTMDFFGGASWRLNNTFKGMKKSYYLNFTAGVTNILNNKKFITGGYEQTRLDFAEKNTLAFPPEYFYAYGTNFFINIAFRM